MRLMVLTPGDSMHAVPWVESFSAAGHDVVVYAYPPVTQDFAGARVRTVEGGGPMSRARWLWRAIEEDAPDVLSMHFVGVDAFSLARPGRPLVLSAWGSDILTELRGRPFKRLLVSAALRSAALVVSPAEHLTAALRGLGVAPVRVLTAQYGVDTERFAPALQVRTAPVRVVCTRGMKAVYGNEDLVHAATKLDPAYVSSVTFTAGGPLLGEMRARADESAAPTEFLGGVPHESMPDLLREFDVYCSMSRSDGTSLSLLEAMAAGLTPVVSDIAANREWIVDGVDGRLVPPGDVAGLANALTEVARDQAFRERAGAAVRAKVLARGDKRANMERIVSAVEGVARA